MDEPNQDVEIQRDSAQTATKAKEAEGHQQDISLYDHPKAQGTEEDGIRTVTSKDSPPPKYGEYINSAYVSNHDLVTEL